MHMDKINIVWKGPFHRFWEFFVSPNYNKNKRVVDYTNPSQVRVVPFRSWFNHRVDHASTWSDIAPDFRASAAAAAGSRRPDGTELVRRAHSPGSDGSW